MQNRPPGGNLGRDCGYKDFGEVGLLLHRERTAIGQLSKAPREGFELLRPVRSGRGGTRVFVQVRGQQSGGLEASLGDSLRPFAGNRNAALIAHAGVVGREGYRDDVHARGEFWREVFGRNNRPSPTRRTPLQFNGGGLILVLEEFDFQRVAAATQKENLALTAAQHRRTHPEIDESILFGAVRRWVNVDADAIRRGDTEIVFTSVRHQERA